MAAEAAETLEAVFEKHFSDWKDPAE